METEIKHNFNIGDKVRARVFDESGNLVQEQVMENQTQYDGLDVISSIILADNPGTETGFDDLAIGIGTGQAATATTLASEIVTNGGQRAASTGTQATTTRTNDTSVLTHEWTFTGAFTVTEAGIFNAGTLGKMLAYTGSLNVTVATGYKLEIQWSIVFS
jgi:hypothetical protein